MIQKMSKWFLIKNIVAALLIKTVFYAAVSAFMIWLFSWADIISSYSWRYVLAMTVSLLLFSVMFSRAEYQDFARR
jgi:hypothetical protein